MKCNSYTDFFMNFANRTKFSIISCLGDGPLSVNEITKKVGEEQSTVSHNLAKLAACHILDVKKIGKERIYSLNKETVVPILKIVGKHVSKNCCKECSKWKKE
jgi:ArsR family transcriptional regulator, lead/cadmium/zinc/bismuth-responsive transcriptional repressor